jgi:hypothetical protein
MGIENDTDQPDQLRSDLSAEQQAAADKGAEDAFALAFGSDTSTPAPAAAQEKRIDAPAADKADTNDEDPFKDLHPKVRDMLAQVPTLTRDYESLKGRLGPTQRRLAETERELAALRAAAPAPAAPAETAEVTKVRGELPEVADAIRAEVRAALGTLAPKEPTERAAAPAPAEQGESEEAKALASKHADWRQVMPSTDYRLWVAAQGADYQNEIMSTSDPEKVSESLSKFKAHKQRSDTSTRQALDENTRRNNRTAGAVAPAGRSAPPGDRSQMSEFDAMMDAFNSP